MNQLFKLKLNHFVLLVFFLGMSHFSGGQDMLLSWDFEEVQNRTVREKVSGIADTLEGYFAIAEGVKGKGLKLDGFTVCLQHNDPNMPVPGNELTVEAWVAVSNYPWNWCPVLTTETSETKGYRLMLGPHGQVSMQVAIAEQWVSCSTERLTIPLRKWMHVVGVYRANKDLMVYVNGELKAQVPLLGKMNYPGRKGCTIGMVAHPEKPSDIHRTWGTLPQYFGITGIVDEIKVFNRAKTSAQLAL